MKKVVLIKLVKIVLKHLIPLVLAYLEGDTHALEDILIQIL